MASAATQLNQVGIQRERVPEQALTSWTAQTETNMRRAVVSGVRRLSGEAARAHLEVDPSWGDEVVQTLRYIDARYHQLVTKVLAQVQAITGSSILNAAAHDLSVNFGKPSLMVTEICK